MFLSNPFNIFYINQQIHQSFIKFSPNQRFLNKKHNKTEEQTNISYHSNHENSLSVYNKVNLIKTIILKKSKHHQNQNKYKKEGYFYPFLDGPRISYDLFKLFQESFNEDEKNRNPHQNDDYENDNISKSQFGNIEERSQFVKGHSEEELEEEYKNYITKSDNYRLDMYYKENSNEEWFKEKYDPIYIKRIKEEISLFSINKLKLFNDIFIENQLFLNQNLCKIALYINANDYHINDMKEKDVKVKLEDDENDFDVYINEDLLYKSRLFSEDIDSNSLYIPTLPKFIKRQEIYKILIEMKGFVYFLLSDPIKSQGNSRFCIIKYNNEENQINALEKFKDVSIGNYKLYPTKSRNDIRKVKMSIINYDCSCENNTFDCISNLNCNSNILNQHIELAYKLIFLFFKMREMNFSHDFDEESEEKEGEEKKVLIIKYIYSIFKKLSENNEQNQYDNISDSINKTSFLDLMIIFLRKVFNFCFYCGVEYENEKQLVTKCGINHIRSNKTNINQIDTKSTSLKSVSNNLISYIEKHSSSSLSLDYDSELSNRRSDYLKNNIHELEEDKFKCKLCPKMFKGFQFIKNHVLNKHSDDIYEVVEKPVSYYISKLYMTSTYLINYINQLVLQPSKIRVFCKRLPFRNVYFEGKDH